MKKQLIAGIALILIFVGISGCLEDEGPENNTEHTYKFQYEVKNEWQSDKYIEIILSESSGSKGYRKGILSLGNESYGNSTLKKISSALTIKLTVGIYNKTSPQDSKGRFIEDYAITLQESEWTISNNESPVKFIIQIDETGNISIEK